MAPLRIFRWLPLLAAGLAIVSCQPALRQADGAAGPPRVLAVESFVGDIAQNVAGDRLTVEVLIPAGVDPHSFEPTPADVRKVADSDLLIVNGAGLEGFLEELLRSAGPQALVVNASEGLASRTPGSLEPHAEPGAELPDGDPHFWLDPNLVVTYVQNIRDALVEADRAARDSYATNTERYIAQLKELDAWIKAEVEQVPPSRRKLVTNHESLGYFADRYGFEIVGTLIPSVSTGATPSAQDLARLIEQIRRTGAPAVFLETGANRQLAEQVARETGVRVVDGLLTHSVTSPDGAAPDYISLMETNVRLIVETLR